MRAGILLLPPKAARGSAAGLKRWATTVGRAGHDIAPGALVAAALDQVAIALGDNPVGNEDQSAEAAAVLRDIGEPPGGWADPGLPGLVHEQAATSDDRRARGAWYTPRLVVDGLLQAATADIAVPGVARFVDPTCGGGAFLLSALDLLVAAGVNPADALERVAGMDTDRSAVDVCRSSLRLWLYQQLGRPPSDDELNRIDVRHGDALSETPSHWRDNVVVVGNPPFATPLKAGAIGAVAAAVRERRADVLGPYADLASIHLLRVIEAVEPGSTVALIQPQSILSSRDTEGLRAWLDEMAPLQGLWAARELLFDAGVRACAPVLRVGATPGTAVRLYHGASVHGRGSRPAQRWGGLAADALGAPDLPRFGDRRLGSLVSATAGFRDEHYALVAACREGTDDGGENADLAAGVGRLFTVGSVDPLSAAWGRRPFRFGGRSWTRPIVDREDLPDRVQRWFDRLQRPKVLLATQAKVLEPYVDRLGDVVPATPLIAVMADSEDLDRVAAVLLAPPVVLWAWRRWFGAAMSVDAVKLAAKQVGELPLPTDHERWDEAAALVADSDGLVGIEARERSNEIAAIMNAAYGADRGVIEWWMSRQMSRRVVE